MPIDVVCGGCDKRFRLKDELAGKRFECKACGKVLTASPTSAAAPAAANIAPQSPTTGQSRPSGRTASQQGSAGTSGTSPQKRKIAPQAELAPIPDPIPDPFADDYDKPETDNTYGEIDDFGDDLGDDYGDDYAEGYSAPPPKKRKKKKAAVKTKGFKKSKPKSSFADGLPPMTFNLNRLNAGLAIAGCVLIFAGCKEFRLVAGTSSTATEMTLAALYADGPGDAVYLTISGAEPVTDFYVATVTRFGKMSEVWYACAPQNEAHQPRFLLYSTQASTKEDVLRLMTSRIHTGMLISNVSGLDGETKGLFRQNVPGINVDSPIILQVGCRPSGFFKWGGMILGGLALLLGGLFWIFFVHD